MSVGVSVRSGACDACSVQITTDLFTQGLNYPGLGLLLIGRLNTVFPTASVTSAGSF